MIKMRPDAKAKPDATSKSGPSKPSGVNTKMTALPDGGCMPPRKGSRSKAVFS